MKEEEVADKMKTRREEVGHSTADHYKRKIKMASRLFVSNLRPGKS